MSVSVIIPAYNAAHCLRTCLDSVFAQTLRLKGPIPNDVTIQRFF